MKKEYEIKAEVSIRLNTEDIDDIMSCALEGGINYWCNEVRANEIKLRGQYISEQISRGGALFLFDSESDEIYCLTLERLLDGIKLYLEKGYDEEGAFIGKEVDICKIDAVAADIIIQLALFGEIIYG